ALLTRFEFEKEQYFSNKGGGLGYGLPAAVGAALAEKQTDSPRDVIGFIGDGSYLYYPQSIYSAVRQNLDLTVVIPDNRNYRILKDNILNILGGDEDDYDFDEMGMNIDPNVDFVKNVESYGGDAEIVETPDGIAPALENALESNGVNVVDVLVHD
ncbi:MAG: thiamine pyrophosphate-dependent enzyme, partial [Halobacteria archaeon]|nr:thiamine pyrophosphate-dependent enzyme [Halobacteria archaeon]